MSMLKCMVHDPEGQPKPVAPPGYHFEVTDSPDDCADMTVADDMDEDCVLVVKLIDSTSGSIVAVEGVYQLDNPQRWVELCMTACLKQLDSKWEELEQRAALKRFVGFYPPKEI